MRIRSLTGPLLSVVLALGAGAVHAQADVFVDAGRGPVALHLPPAFDGATSLPLVLNLHGYGGEGASQQTYFALLPQADARGVMVAIPDGDVDASSARFWDATDACCDFFDANPDDSAYLRRLIETIAQNFPTDDRRIYVVGYSNGGFMSHRMACDHADLVAAIFSFAGAQWEVLEQCVPSEPVSVVQFHGTADFTIAYGGGCIPGLACYPSARTTALTWAMLNGCGSEVQAKLPLLDLVERRPGLDTLRQEYSSCIESAVELWSSPRTGHVPTFTAAFAPAVMDFLLAHPKGAEE
ncbi:MAG: PHB depolymerase family esterase [Pseudomonadota bacterium]